ncbi:uncharacterized protein LOC113311286 [Papaver somniferum]|uniref:uncharacterized protein LOC113311286 n=1 Tax=Papaver somniferum TaxID=3469 RepID=UPI000E7019D9|nr:uncharacterized protein LOC113311286 [Papaver somniferum]
MAPRNNSAKTSSPGGKETFRHFTHPHVLVKEALDQEVYTSNRFGCDGCGMDGTGVRYHCKPCGFDLHVDCGTCPEQLTNFIHPDHPSERDGRDQRVMDGVLAINVVSTSSWSYKSDSYGLVIHPQCVTLPNDNVQSSGNTHCSALSQVEQAQADADELAAAMISAKARKNMLSYI